jgi:hypothetical protein
MNVAKEGTYKKAHDDQEALDAFKTETATWLHDELVDLLILVGMTPPLLLKRLLAPNHVRSSIIVMNAARDIHVTVGQPVQSHTCCIWPMF